MVCRHTYRQNNAHIINKQIKEKTKGHHCSHFTETYVEAGKYHRAGVQVSQDCHNNVLLTEWLKQWEFVPMILNIQVLDQGTETVMLYHTVCSSFISVSVIKHPDKKQQKERQKERGLILIYNSRL